MKRWRIGLLGHGTVGKGTADLLEKREAQLHRKGFVAQLVAIAVTDVDKHKTGSARDALFTNDAEAVASDPSIDLVIEAIGGIDSAKRLIERALRSGKHVVTANKDLLAEHLDELLALAEQNGVALRYEAAVAGGIPVLAALEEGLAGDEITAVTGILNGTSNYILTKMEREGIAYADALVEAQQLGYAEADPSADVEGTDAARKLLLLGRLAFGVPARLSSVSIAGIRDISLGELARAREAGCAIKLIGRAARDADGEWSFAVAPARIPLDSPLAGVSYEANAVLLEGEAIGSCLLQGPGAGGPATGLAIVADALAIMRGKRSIGSTAWLSGGCGEKGEWQ